MKMMIAVALLFVAVGAKAGPYFRGPWDWASGKASPSPSVGACIDINGGPSEQCTTVGIITHSPNDGYLIVPGEDWSLLSLGYSMVGWSKVRPIASADYNVLPILVWAGQTAGLNLSIPGISAKGISLSGSVAPVFEYDPTVSGGGKGYFRIKTAGAIHFGGKPLANVN